MRDTLAASWKDIADRVVQLATEFPEEKYDFRPAPEVRSFAEQLRHVAFWNDYTTAQLKGEEPDGSANELPAAQYATREAVVQAVRRSFDDVIRSIERNGVGKKPAAMQSLVAMLEHNGEHYGQMVVYYRLNGLVPPSSR